MASSHCTLASSFAVLAVLQTAVPMIVQKMTAAIIYHHLFHGAIASCVLAAIVVAIYQVSRRRFDASAMILVYIGLVLLVAFDICIERAIDASC